MADYPLAGKKVDTVSLEWYELDKRLLRKVTEGGTEIGIRLEAGAHLHEGDVLCADDKKVIAVDILPCELTVVSVSTMQQMGRLCFELGNRHLSLSIGEQEVRVPYDEPTFSYLEKLGFAPEKQTAKFTHVTVCHAHGHSHSHGDKQEHGHSHSHDGEHAHE